jgi:imidazolonepropionase-like amidohydrolase
MPGIVRLLVVVRLAAPLLPQPAAKPSFRLFLLGHEIGREVVKSSRLPDGERLSFDFSFTDRGTTVDLAATLELDAEQNVRHFVTKGRTYRLFAADSEVTVTDGRARVRDGTRHTTVDAGDRPFFPVDNYAPIGAHERLIRYWIAKGRPAEIAAPPAGVVRITSRGVGPAPGRIPGRRWEKLAIEGAVWGRETAWIDLQTKTLQALATWAGGLNFMAVRGTAAPPTALAAVAAADQVADLGRMGKAAPAVRTGAFAIVGATLIDGTTKPPLPDAVLIVRDGRISGVGAANAVPVPAGLPVVDGKGLFVLPGLWDMHAHVGQADWAPTYLASGVTTIRDMGGEFEFLTRFRDAIDKGAPGPRVLLAGLVDGPGDRAFGAVTAATPDEGRAVVRRYHAARFQQIKIYSLVPIETVKAIVAEAHRLGLTVTGHVPAGMTAHSAVEAGFDSLAHMPLRGSPGSDEAAIGLAFFRQHKTVLDPTQSWNELGGHPASVALDAFLPGVSALPAPLKRMFDSMPGGNAEPAAWRARLVDSARLLKQAVDAGLLVVAGTDKGVPGFSLHRELELYVAGGMTPLQAIQTATIMPARAMKLDKDVGTIETGKRADLVLLSADPLASISNVRAVRWVVANGRLYDPAALWKAAGFKPRSQ